jgi:NADH dehydrogenase/NADH:ubiquinone oxidoreductase subunit G
MAVNVFADDRLITASTDQNLLQASLKANLQIPYFCWHPSLGAVGSCRQCAVKLFNGPADQKGQIVMACMTKPTADMRFSVDDPEAVAFRAAVVEMVLTNHPHDCPVCEVGGECHLQDMTVLTGHHRRRYNFPKRTHLNQNLGPFIRHEMNRCIGCYRCVRFYRDYAGGDDFGVFGSNRNIYFGRAEDGALTSDFAGNLVEVCPTGVFVDKPFSAKFRRKWDLRATPSVCPHCAVGCNITVQERDGVFRRTVNRYNETLNGYFLCDRGRFGTGFVSGAARLRQARDRAGNVLSAEAARAKLSTILATGDVIGIGSPRASIEANVALRALVGPTNFYAGLSAFDAAGLETALSILRRIRPATLQQIEQADAVLVMGDDPSLVAPRLALALRQVARRVDNVAALSGALRPVVVAGGDAAVMVKAANLVLALRRQGVAAQLSLLLPEANSVGLGLMDCRTLGAAAAAAIGRHVIVLERDVLREPEAAAMLFAGANSVTVLDHIKTPSGAQADLAIGVASFAESDGVFVNFEGRAQAFFKAILAADNAPPSWQVLRDVGFAAGLLETGEWRSHAALLEAMAAALPALAACRDAWPREQTSRPATLPHRHSGRTAANANVDVREMLPLQHEDSPLGATMEGDRTALPWAPGWNSVQVQQITPVSGLNLPQLFLFEDRDGGDFPLPEYTIPDDRRLGIEELSSLSPAIIAYRQQSGR